MTAIAARCFVVFRGLSRGLDGPSAGLIAMRPIAAVSGKEGLRGRKTNYDAPTRCPTRMVVSCQTRASKRVRDVCCAVFALFLARAPTGLTTAILHVAIAALSDEIRSTGSTSLRKAVVSALVPSVAIITLAETCQVLSHAEAGGVCERTEGPLRPLAVSGSVSIFCATVHVAVDATVSPSGLERVRRFLSTSRCGRRPEIGIRARF